MKRHILFIVSAALLLSVFSGCSTSNNDAMLYTGEYFSDQSPTEHFEYLRDTFISILPYAKNYKESGVGGLWTLYADEAEGIVHDKLIPGPNYIYLASEIPVFYGLLMRSQEYEKKTGVDNSAIAKNHGKSHAIKAENVDRLCTMMFRKDVKLHHQSTSGAEYIAEDGLYVYDKLLDPFQEFKDRGWELDYAEYFPIQKDKVWNSDFDGSYQYCPIWYSSDGTMYDLYGDKICKQEDPDNRFLLVRDLLEYLVNIGEYTMPAEIPLGLLNIFPQEAKPANGEYSLDLSVQIRSIDIGLGLVQYGDFRSE